MKTVISLPDDTFEQASRRARALGLTRSEFFARAAERYLQELDTASITGQVDEALQILGIHDDPAAEAVAYGHGLLADTDEW